MRWFTGLHTGDPPHPRAPLLGKERGELKKQKIRLMADFDVPRLPAVIEIQSLLEGAGDGRETSRGGVDKLT